MTSVDDDREALKKVWVSYTHTTPEEANEWWWRDAVGLADAILAAGFRRQPPITDAQVEAAESALGWNVGATNMRAALEAARDAS